MPGKSRILLIGMFPPPVCGMTVITEKVCEQISSVLEVKLVKLSGHGRFALLKKMIGVVKGAGIILFRKRLGVDRLYMPMDGGFGRYLCLLLIVLMRLRGGHIYLHHHSWSYISKKCWCMAVINSMVDRCGAHIFLCETMRVEFAKTYGKTCKSIIISNSSFINTPSTLKRKSDRNLTIGHLSNLSIEKGLDAVVNVFKLLKDEGASVRLVLAGPASDRSSRKIIDNVRLMYKESVTYLGPVYDQEKVDFFRKIDVFLFPTRYKLEAQPLVVFEALHSGTPVIAYARGCIDSQIMQQGGYAINPNSCFEQKALAIIRRISTNLDELNQTLVEAYRQSKLLKAEHRGDLEQLLAILQAGAGKTV